MLPFAQQFKNRFYKSNMIGIHITYLLTLTALLPSTFCEDGTAHLKQLFQAGDACNAPEGSWTPLPDGVPCGNANCDWPSRWCVIVKGDNAPNFKCVDVPQECQNAMGVTPTPLTPPTPQVGAGGDNNRLPAPPGGQPSQPTDNGCLDMHPFCCYWAQNGECDKNIYFMRVGCQKSCGTCGCRVEKAETCTVNLNVADCKIVRDSVMQNAGCNPIAGCNNAGQTPTSQQRGCPQPSGCLPFQQQLQQNQPCFTPGGCGSNMQQQVGCGGGCGGRSETTVVKSLSRADEGRRVAQSPTLGGRGGCSDYMTSCSRNMCQKWKFMNNMCQQTCGGCRK